ncbi:MAG: hypothetical protein KatS3mg068_1577 [Candidatus Sericytochromatia bacterium]|nr:MAG: hypothetical protein KatS3mg068_1577 [Candidatus Sericytochromatia bacterium]
MQITTTNGSTVNNQTFNAGKNYVNYNIEFVANGTSETFDITHSRSTRLTRFAKIFLINDGTNPVVPPTEVSGVTIVPYGTDYQRNSRVQVSGLTSGRVYKLEITLLNDDQD